MPRFRVRIRVPVTLSCEYTCTVEAENEDDAEKTARSDVNQLVFASEAEKAVESNQGDGYYEFAGFDAWPAADGSKS